MVWVELGQGIAHVLSAPFRDLSVLWQLIPIVLMWVLLEVYFVRWHEKLGWNSALANAITLFWISVTSMQIVFATVFSWSKFVVFFLAIVYALVLATAIFRHAMREKFAFIIASPVVIHFVSMIFVLWAHSLVSMSLFVFLAIVVLFVLFVLLDVMLKYLIHEEQVVEGRVREEIKDWNN